MLPSAGEPIAAKPQFFFASPEPWSRPSLYVTRKWSSLLHSLRLPPTSFARILQYLSYRETVSVTGYEVLPAVEKSWASMLRKPPSLATCSSYEMPAVGPLSVDSAQYSTTSP